MLLLPPPPAIFQQTPELPATEQGWWLSTANKTQWSNAQRACLFETWRWSGGNGVFALSPDLHPHQQNRERGGPKVQQWLENAQLAWKELQKKTSGLKNEKCTLRSGDRQINTAHSGVKWRLDPWLITAWCLQQKKTHTHALGQAAYFSSSQANHDWDASAQTHRSASDDNRS